MSWKLLGIVAVLSFTACYRATVTTGLSARSQAPTSEVGVSFLWGISPMTAKAVECRDGLAMVSTSLPWWGALVGLFTAGIITPWETQYWCATKDDRGTAAPVGTP